jgi:hypothetical protein
MLSKNIEVKRTEPHRNGTCALYDSAYIDDHEKEVTGFIVFSMF